MQPNTSVSISLTSDEGTKQTHEISGVLHKTNGDFVARSLGVDIFLCLRHIGFTDDRIKAIAAEIVSQMD